jgi:Predicted ATP-binding protein involved in virulence
VIRKLRLENFRGVVEGEIELDKLTILVGPNNSGRTTILEALFLAPNPFRAVPYFPMTVVELLATYHRALNEKGYTFLVNKYTAEKAVIGVDGTEIIFRKMGPDLIVFVNHQPPGFALQQYIINGKELFYVGTLEARGSAGGVGKLLLTPNTLMLSTKLVGFAHEYLRQAWIEISNKGYTAAVAKDVSRYVAEDYVNLTVEPFMGGELSLFAMLSDGTRVRLSDLGAGVHLYVVNRLLYEHYRPEVVLWDDVETYLNPRLLSHVAEWFADLVDEGKQVVVSTHSLEAVETLTTFVEDATVLLTSLKDGILTARKIKLDELQSLARLGVDPRMAESFLL